MILSRNMLKRVGESRHPCRTPNVVRNQGNNVVRLKKIWGRTTARKKGKLLLRKTSQGSASQKNEKYWTDGQIDAPSCTSTRPMENSSELSPYTHRRRPLHPSQWSGGCSTIIEEMEVSWSWKHPSRTGPSRWKGCNHRSHDNLQQDLADRRMANPMDQVLSHHTSQER